MPIDAKFKQEIANAEYVSIGHGGHTVHMKSDDVSSRIRLQGYGLDEDEVAYIVEQGVPLIDKTVMDDNVLAAAAVFSPMVDSRQYDAPPWGGYSKAPLEAVAGLYKALGARVENIDTVNVTADMLRPNTKRETLISQGFLTHDPGKIVLGLTESDTPSEILPLAPETLLDRKAVKILDLLRLRIQEQLTLKAAYDEEQKQMSASDFREKYPEYQELNPHSIIRNIEAMAAPLLYNALLHASGQLTSAEMMQRIGDGIKDRQKVVKENLKGHSPEWYSHLHAAAKESGKLSRSICARCDRAVNTAPAPV